MASLAALFVAYSIGQGDTIHVGPGTYTLLETVVLSAADSGVTITGPIEGSRPSSHEITPASTSSI